MISPRDNQLHDSDRRQHLGHRSDVEAGIGPVGKHMRMNRITSCRGKERLGPAGNEHRAREPVGRGLGIEQVLHSFVQLTVVHVAPRMLVFSCTRCAQCAWHELIAHASCSPSRTQAPATARTAGRLRNDGSQVFRRVLRDVGDDVARRHARGFGLDWDESRATSNSLQGHQDRQQAGCARARPRPAPVLRAASHTLPLRGPNTHSAFALKCSVAGSRSAMPMLCAEARRSSVTASTRPGSPCASATSACT